MGDDLTTRLRDAEENVYTDSDLLAEAADRLDVLEAENRKLRHGIEAIVDEWTAYLDCRDFPHDQWDAALRANLPSLTDLLAAAREQGDTPAERDRFGRPYCTSCGVVLVEPSEGCQSCGAPSAPATAPMGLWQQALSEFPEDEATRRLRYFELMVEAGHVLLPDDPAPSAPVLPEPDDVLRAIASALEVDTGMGETAFVWEAYKPEGVALVLRQRLTEAGVLAASSPGVEAEPERASDVPVPTPADAPRVDASTRTISFYDGSDCSAFTLDDWTLICPPHTTPGEADLMLADWSPAVMPGAGTDDGDT